MSRKKIPFPKISKEKLREAEDLKDAGWEAGDDAILGIEPDYESAESFFRQALELYPVLADA